MPGKVKVKIISGKNLPVMDRSSDTTDAYVEIKLGNTTYKTDVCRRTLHPQWNTDWYRFEVDDSELQDEPLQIRLMDHDTYSANDAIGKVYLNLNPLLLPVAGQLAIGDNNPHHEISGWIPVYDTMHGIRGEVNVTVKVELFSDFNRFRQSSCGVHFFYSPTVPQGYQAKIINGFVEELIVDDDPEYQWIDKIRTPRASNEARQTLFFKLSGELQRKIGVKALSLGGNAVIGYRQCFDLEGESGIVARGIGTAVTLVKAVNMHHVVAEPKEEDIENYLKFVGDGKSFSLCSTSPTHKLPFPFSLFSPTVPPDITPVTSSVPKLTKRQYMSLDSNIMSSSISNPNLHEGKDNIKVLLNQEDKRGKSAMSRRFQKFKHSQKSLSKKMIALKAKLNDSIGEEADDSQLAMLNKRKLFKRTSSDSSAMAEILARSVMRATSSLSCILEDQPHSSNEDDTLEKLEPIATLLNQSESENTGLDEIASDAQSCSSSDSSSSCSYYEYRDYSKANNDVETISNIITNVERLQRCLSREGLHKQYSLPAIPTKGFSLNSLDNLSQFENRDDFQTGILTSKASLNDSSISVSSSISNLSRFDETSPKLNKRRSSDGYDYRYIEAAKGFSRPRKLERFDEIDIEEGSIGLSQGSMGNLTYTSSGTQLVESSKKLSLEANPFTFLSSHSLGQRSPEIYTKFGAKIEENNVKDTALQTTPFERTNMLVNDQEAQNDKSSSRTAEYASNIAPQENNMEPKTMIGTALQTMLFERANILGTPTALNKKQIEYPESQLKYNKDVSNQFTCKIKDEKSNDFKVLEHVEPEPKGIIKTALQTMLIERAGMLGSDNFNAEESGVSELRETARENLYLLKNDDKKEIKSKGIVKRALKTILVERADLLGTANVKSPSQEEVPEVHQPKSVKSDERKDPEPKGIVKTALQTMLIDRANILGSTADQPVESVLSNLNSCKESNPTKEIENRSPDVVRKPTTISIQQPEDLTEHSCIAPFSLDNINIEPKKMIKTAMQTMLLEKFNLLGTYTPPTSPTLITGESKSGQAKHFTFNEIDSRKMSIPKSSSSASFGGHHRQKETVLGMPFTSLSSLISEYDNNMKPQKASFFSDSYLHQHPTETLKEKAGARKKRFKFLLSKASEQGKPSGMFHKFRRSSKKSLSEDTPKDQHQNILSRMFHPRHEEKSNKDEETQTPNEVLEYPVTPQMSECNISPNNIKTKILIDPPKPPSHIDLASGDFLAHSKTKSACITSHHSSPAQERQEQNGGDRKDEHSPDPCVRISHSPVKVNYMVPLHRRSSDSDLSITPKGNSLTGSDKSMGNAAAYFMRNHYIRRGQINQDHFDMLEYPFLTMTKFSPKFIVQIGGSISARSVKLLERISNVDEPESRDIWWSEIRMEIRSHARSLNCNAVLGYTELTSICDDVCVLSACGTAAVIDFTSSAGEDDNFSAVQLIHKNVERDKYLNGQYKSSHESPEHRIHSMYSCSLTHLPYDEKSVPLKAKVTKCPICLKGKVPEVLIATIEPPEAIPSVGKGCFIESHVSRPLKDLRGETIAKDISDGLPFLEYELHRILVNKLKIKGMNAIFSLKIRISVGEKMLVGVATGTAIYLSCLPSPDLPMLVTDKVSDEKLVANLQEMLNETVKKNKEIYQIKDDNQSQKCLSDEDSDEDQASLDISCGNKDCCILEMDDPDDAEVLRLLMQEKVPEGFHVVSTESVPGLEDLEIVKNLQMFTQIYRAKVAPPYNLQKHFVRLLQSVYFKLRRMVPCALCDLQFRIDIPEPDEIQLCVIGMALGLGKKAKKPAVATKKPEEDLIFKLDDEHTQESPQTQLIKSNPSSIKFRSHRSPSKYRNQSLKQRHIPYNERHGVDITPLSYVPGGTIEQYLGNLNFFFIRETTSIREEGGLSGFIHSFITEVLAIVRSHVTALGGNALVAFFMTECVLNHNLHKNQGQCLINVGGDVVSVCYFKDEP